MLTILKCHSGHHTILSLYEERCVALRLTLITRVTKTHSETRNNSQRENSSDEY